ncbi:hypothetical protein D0T53_05655 [Dysgonomonas sp. 216]|uniref:Rieske (2Fe-2S) protein n=1 Tax=Dysgonomonas sp. 216 TaxID=2302934 RepID=UPI0013D1E6C4|nr:hypothetical protein [Dysgonomonas sp. 216]NDW18402.1 hypothetical protein [Dysgonomonas sp. 216]
MKLYIPVILFLSTLLFSCGEEELDYTIPRARVYFRVELSGRDNALKNQGHYEVFTEGRGDGEYIYVGYSGLIIFNHGLDDDYPLAAYDRCCPNEDSKTITVTPNTQGKAVCNKCKSEFSLYTGQCLSGPAKERLQSYRVRRGTSQYEDFVFYN